jgi:uncharacterized protein (TIGR02147 family)
MSTNINFNIFLKEELKRRKVNNPGYSMRAFSKQLGLSSSFISKVLSGQKNISEETLLQISSRLNLDVNELDVFVKSKQPERRPTFNLIDRDQFQFIADWHHYAILESATLPDFKATPAWVSSKINISKELAAASIDRLKRLGLIKVCKDNKLIGEIKNHTTTGWETPSSAHTERERQLLYKAIEALDQVPVSDRSQSSMTMAIPASRISEAKNKIKEFQREMSKLLQRKGERDSVYQLSVAFFPLTPSKKNKK